MTGCQTLDNAGFPQPLPSPGALGREHPCDHGTGCKEYILLLIYPPDVNPAQFTTRRADCKGILG